MLSVMQQRRIVTTAEALRALPYHSPVAGWHSHGQHLIPSDGCAACAELRARTHESPATPEGGG